MELKKFIRKIDGVLGKRTRISEPMREMVRDLVAKGIFHTRSRNLDVDVYELVLTCYMHVTWGKLNDGGYKEAMRLQLGKVQPVTEDGILRVGLALKECRNVSASDYTSPLAELMAVLVEGEPPEIITEYLAVEAAKIRKRTGVGPQRAMRNAKDSIRLKYGRPHCGKFCKLYKDIYQESLERACSVIDVW